MVSKDFFFILKDKCNINGYERILNSQKKSRVICVIMQRIFYHKKKQAKHLSYQLELAFQSRPPKKGCIFSFWEHETKKLLLTTDKTFKRC